MEVDTVKEEKEKEEAVAQTTVGDNETGAEAPKGNKQQGRGPRNNRQGGKRTWEKERKKEKKVEMEKRVAAADKSEETPKTATPLTELPKKSYSSAMKSNLVEKATNSNSPATAAPKSNSTSSQKEERPVQRVPAVKETPAVRESEEVWETVPPSVAAGEPESWERTPQSKKRKHKKSAREAVVRFEVKEEVEEAEQEEKRKKEGRRRRKKHGSEDPEEGAGGHRVVICDDQVEIQFMRSGQRPSDLLLAPQMDKVATTNLRPELEMPEPQVKSGSFADFLIVSELGCGIQRGCMGLGRLYQGKYVPPERTDGLLPEEKRVLEEKEEDGETTEKDKEEEEEETETSATPAADIDLD